jgi:hypothetical protein
MRSLYGPETGSWLACFMQLIEAITEEDCSMASDKKSPIRPQSDPQPKDERHERSTQRPFERKESDRDDKPDTKKLGKRH